MVAAHGSQPVAVDVTRPPVPANAIADLEKRANALCDHQDYVNAAPLNEQACSAGSLEGCDRRAQIGNFGWIAPYYDPAKAKKLFSDTCDKGYGLNCYHLYYLSGHIDASLARGYLEEGCSFGNQFCCEGLGADYKLGADGLQKDKVQARKFFARACSLGSKYGCDQARKLY